MIETGEEIKKLKLLAGFPLSAKQKINKLSEYLMSELASDEMLAAKITLNAQKTLENNAYTFEGSSYNSEWYQYTAKIIQQGQKEKSVVSGAPMKLADYYWGVVYLYSLKRLFTSKYEPITAQELSRILLKDQ